MKLENIPADLFWNIEVLRNRGLCNAAQKPIFSGVYKRMGMFLCFTLIGLDIIFVSLKYNSLTFPEFSAAFIFPIVLMSVYVAYGAKQENRERQLSAECE